MKALLTSFLGFLLVTPLMAGEDLPSLKQTFRFYGNSPYLPNGRTIYEARPGLKVKLKVSSDAQDLACFNENRNGEKSPFRDLVVIDTKVQNIDCKYEGKEKFIDVEVDYFLERSDSAAGNLLYAQRDLEQKKQASFESPDWYNLNSSDIERFKLYEEVSKDIPASGKLIEFPLAQDAAVKLSGADGEVTYGISTYGVSGKPGPVAGAGFISPEAEPYSLVCGNISGKKIEAVDLVGVRTLRPSDRFACAVNVRLGGMIRASGGFSVKLRFTSKASVENALKKRLDEIQVKISQSERTEQGQNLENYKKLEQLLTQFKEQGNSLSAKEPQEMCSTEVPSEAFNFEVKKKLILGDVGQFCSTPIEISVKKYLTICENGRFVIFNDLFKILKNVTLPSTDDLTTISSMNRPLLLADNQGFLLTTKDGRILIYTSEGILKKTLPSKSLYINNPIALENGLFAAVAFDDVYSDNQTLLIFNRDKILKQVELGSDERLSDPQWFEDSLFLTSDKGHVLGLNSEGEETFNLHLPGSSALSPPSIKNQKLYVGTNTGTFWEIDLSTARPRVIYQAAYSGKMGYDLTNDRSYPLVPAIIHAPLMLEDGRIAVATAYDGRIHFLEASGKLIHQVEVPFVNALLGFSKIAGGSGLILTSSISYITLLSSTGMVHATYTNGGAENPFTPLDTGNSSFMNGMFNGVFNFVLTPKADAGKRSILVPCVR